MDRLVGRVYSIVCKTTNKQYNNFMNKIKEKICIHVKREWKEIIKTHTILFQIDEKLFLGNDIKTIFVPIITNPIKNTNNEHKTITTKSFFNIFKLWSL